MPDAQQAVAQAVTERQLVCNASGSDVTVVLLVTDVVTAGMLHVYSAQQAAKNLHPTPYTTRSQFLMLAADKRPDG
jgi:hypothetical protein